MKIGTLLLAFTLLVSTTFAPKRAEASVGIEIASTALIIAGAATFFYPPTATVLAFTIKNNSVRDVLTAPMRLIPCSGWSCIGTYFISGAVILIGGFVMLDDSAATMEFTKIDAAKAVKLGLTEQEVREFNDEKNLAKLNRTYQSITRSLVKKHNQNYNDYVNSEDEAATTEYAKIMADDIQAAWTKAAEKNIVSPSSVKVIQLMSAR